MSGKKSSSAAKNSSKGQVTGGQHNLFHFYQKQSKVKDDAKKSVGNINAEVATLSSNNAPTAEDVPSETASPPIEKSELVQTSCLNTPGDTRSSQCPQETTGGSPSSAQTISATIAENGLTQRESRPSIQVRPKVYAIFENPRACSASSQALTESTHEDGQAQSSSKSCPYKMGSRKEGSGKAGSSNVIDLTDTSGDHTARSASVIIIDDDQPSANDMLCGSRNAPIDLRTSPIAEQRSLKVVHPFFVQNATKSKGPSIPHLTNTASKLMEAPWPNAENQHCIGPQTSFQTPDSPLLGKHIKTPAFIGGSTTFYLRFYNNTSIKQPPFWGTSTTGVELYAPTSIQREAVVSSLPSIHRRHPGIMRLLDGALERAVPSSNDGGEMWSQKWRPRRATEILGNEHHALYLKAWLQALEIREKEKLEAAGTGTRRTFGIHDNVRGTKRPTVLRTVIKKRGRKRRRIGTDDGSSPEEDWIVDDDQSAVETNMNNSFAQDSSRMQSPTSPPIYNGSHTPEFPILTNTILLTGPPGSGKTSTIYALAGELGWEVFEVYPGIGKRSGSNILSLVGDVGKNHIVGRRGTSVKHGSDQSGFGYLARDGEKQDVPHTQDGNHAIRQSVILLDEVDVLFKEDANFWPMVINIIKTSHRPVFMTCNDISLIPLDDLPLQTCLHFEPCPSPLAVTFLQCVCLVEGHLVPRKQIEVTYARTYTLINCDESDQPLVPYPSQRFPCSDLRRALNDMQLWCSRDLNKSYTETKANGMHSTPAEFTIDDLWAEALADWAHQPAVFCGQLPNSNSKGNEAEGCDIDQIARLAECTSYIDGYLERRASNVLEAFAIDRYGPSRDDEIGYTLLDKPEFIGDHSSGLAFYNRDSDLAQEALAISRHVLEATGAGPRARGNLCYHERGTTRLLESRSLARARVANQTRAVSFLDDVISPSSPLLPRPAAVLDYTPYVQQMILADDVLEAEATAEAARATKERPGRTTRNRWHLGQYPRYLTVHAEGVEAARHMLLGQQQQR
ncbi:P-loop containing nucleoside triphosphate hydrolase protein [Ramaria rubella]|nr:P-loop containing nucleoside triphosphate hydrolase protein [Ramaria rubella]